MPKNAKYPIITSDNPKLKSWRQELAKAALLACCHSAGTGFPMQRPAAVQVQIKFFFKVPKKVNCQYKTTRPDVDKLLRATLDGMAGIVYEDDSQVVSAQVSKQFGLPERVEICAGIIE